MTVAKTGLAGSVLAAILASACGGATDEAVATEILQATPTYDRDVRPILERHCVACHDSRGERAGGVELDRFESAHSNRVRNACVSLTKEIIEAHGQFLRPYPKDPPRQTGVCGDWEPYSMPTGARTRMSTVEQLLLVRWVETGAPR